jgi:hypothetical protein
MTKAMSTVAGAPGRHGFWSAYLPDYLDADGAIKVDARIDRTFVEFTTAVTALATRAAAGKRPGRVACRAYGKHVTCSGAVEAAIEPWPRRIEWWCPVCGDSGSIFGWEWTRWNRMDLWGRGKKVVKKRKRKKAA